MRLRRWDVVVIDELGRESVPRESHGFWTRGGAERFAVSLLPLAQACGFTLDVQRRRAR